MKKYGSIIIVFKISISI